MPARDELREKIADIYCEEAMGVRIGELNEYASDWIEKARRVADRILALLPPQPKLEWQGNVKRGTR